MRRRDFEIKWSTYLIARRAVAARGAEEEELLKKGVKGLLPPCVFKPVNEAVYLETGRVMSLYLGMTQVNLGKKATAKVSPDTSAAPSPAPTPPTSFKFSFKREPKKYTTDVKTRVV